MPIDDFVSILLRTKERHNNWKVTITIPIAHSFYIKGDRVETDDEYEKRKVQEILNAEAKKTEAIRVSKFMEDRDRKKYLELKKRFEAPGPWPVTNEKAKLEKPFSLQSAGEKREKHI